MIISRRIHRKMRNVTGKSAEKNKHTLYVQCAPPPQLPNRAVYEINWKRYGRTREATDDITIRSMRCAYCTNKATDVHPEYSIFIVFPRQQWLRERAPMLLYKYNACRVIYPSIYIWFFQELSSLEELQGSSQDSSWPYRYTTVYVRYATRTTPQVIWIGLSSQMCSHKCFTGPIYTTV